MVEKKVRIDADTNKELLLLTISEDEKSMGKMIKKLIDFYKQSKEESNGEATEAV